MTFSKTLPDGFCENPLLHAYLYVSADKTDRCHTALLIAKSLLCTERNEHALPCGKCSDCIKMESRSHPDCFFFGSDGAKVSVDDIRTISERAYLAPNEANGKVFILEEADTYNTQSQNALLKILEEPPKNVYFILTASSKNALLPTVRSRVCILSGQEKSLDSVKSELIENFPSIAPACLNRMAYFAYSYDGADTKKLNAEIINTAFETCIEFLSGTDDGIDPSRLPKKRDELSVYLQVFMLCTQLLLKAKMTGRAEENALTSQEILHLCAKVSAKRAITLYDKYENTYLRLMNNANENAVISALL